MGEVREPRIEAAAIALAEHNKSFRFANISRELQDEYREQARLALAAADAVGEGDSDAPLAAALRKAVQRLQTHHLPSIDCVRVLAEYDAARPALDPEES